MWRYAPKNSGYDTAWVLVLSLLLISILIFLEFYGGKPELYRLF